ncbi:MAG TPA: lamin tail domain-containing protein [Gaiellaceae bacterium]|nr:lamin tail domain-containing protein [Gaiellaceae bacterium]
MHRFLLLVPLVALALAAGASGARASASGVVVSQVYAGGGNSGATYANDFVELFNGGSSAVDLTGWSIQYASAASTSWSVTALGGSIQPGRHYLVQLASSASVGAALPAPDATGTTNLANTGGKIALVRDGNELTCGGSAGSCAAVASIADLVGYGSAADYEGSGPAPALSSTSAAVRSGNGCTDTNVNSTDFAAADPSPRNSASAAAPCSGGPPTGGGVSKDASVDIDIQPVLSLTLERPTISFGTAVAGDTPAPVSERVTVVSNNAAGYALTAHRTAFAPADLPLAIAVGSGALTPVPIAPAADMTLASASRPSAPGGDVVPTSVGFSSPIPAIAPGHYTATLTYTLIGR